MALAGTTTLATACASAISTQQEIALGNQYAQELARELPLVQDASIDRYINQLGTSIASVADPRPIPYHFYVVNSPAVNAFAVPGGHVYVNRGLIERAGNLSELAGVMAHEIGHVVHRHSVEQLERAQNAQAGLSILYGVILGRAPSGLEQAGIQVGGSAILAGYSRDDEREADSSAIGYLIARGIDPRGLVTMFEKLLEEQQRNPGAVEQWFSTHPTTRERIENTRAAIASLPAGSLQGLTSNSQAFEDFQNRVSRLPSADR